MAIRIVIADNHPIFLKGLEAILTEEAGFAVMAACTNGEDALDAVCRHNPDVVILDIRMPRKDGLAVIREIHDRGMPVKVVVLAGELSENEIIESVRMGVKGVVLKEMDPRLLIRCLHKVCSGGVWLEKQSVKRTMDNMLQREAGLKEMSRLLTKREMGILAMVAKRMRNREIAQELKLSELTVKTHIHHIFKKLNIVSRPQLIQYAKDMGLVSAGKADAFEITPQR